MLQVILRNRVLFIVTIVMIWGLIFFIPKLGEYYRLEKKHERVYLNRKHQTSDSVSHNDYEKEDMTTDYEIAGEFRQGDKCIDTLDGKEGSQIGIWSCHGEGRNQFFFLLKKSQNIRNNQLCLEGPADLKSTRPVLLQACVSEEKQAWVYENENIQLSGSSLCIDNKDTKMVLNECNGSISQKWTLKTPPGM